MIGRLLLMALLLSFANAHATTIAYDGHTIAADSQGTRGDTKAMKQVKLQDCGDYILGGAGVMTVINHFVKDFKELGKEKALANVKQWDNSINNRGEARFICVCRATGVVELIVIKDSFLIADEPLDSPCAIGSGGDYAEGAMHAGATAREAVEIAKNLDLYTGGEVHSILIK